MHGSSENISDRSMEERRVMDMEDSTIDSCNTDSGLAGGITFDAFKIRIRRASTLDEEGTSPKI